MKPLPLLAAALFMLAAPAARAQVPEVRIARQFSMGYLQLNMIEHEKLIQKHAAALGIPEVKVTPFKFNGPAAMNDALLSDSLDIVSGSPQGFYFIWGRTRNTPGAVRAISALASLPYQLITRNPEIKTVADLSKCGKIAVPSVKVSAQAVTIQAAAAQLYGMKDYARFDDLTISMSPPDSMIAMLAGAGDIACTFAVPPYLQQQLQRPGIHAVLNSYDVWGDPNTFTFAYTSSRFHDRNPKLYQAVYDALDEATTLVNKDPRKAAQYWIEDGELKLSVDFVQSIAADPKVTWTMVPQNTLKVAKFMYDVGTLKVMPESWKDYFFPEAYGLPGS